MNCFSLNLFADYHQIYLCDENSEADLSSSWSEEAIKQLVATGSGVVGIATDRNTNVPVRVEILPGDPEVDEGNWDHIAETCVEIPSGCIVFAGCTEYFQDAFRAKVSPGEYRVRISYGDLSKLSEDKLSGKDHYRIQIWVGSKIETRVLKWRIA